MVRPQRARLQHEEHGDPVGDDIRRRAGGVQRAGEAHRRLPRGAGHKGREGRLRVRGQRAAPGYVSVVTPLASCSCGPLASLFSLVLLRRPAGPPALSLSAAVILDPPDATRHTHTQRDTVGAVKTYKKEDIYYNEYGLSVTMDG